MKYYQWMGLIATACVTFSARADLMNISSTSLQSSTEEAIACGIITTNAPTYQGYKVLVGYSEGSTSDSNPTLRVRSLSSPNTYENDNWRGVNYLNGQSVNVGSDLVNLYSSTLGRTPGGTNDSAILMIFRPGEAVCAFSKEVSNSSLKKVSVSLTDITAKIAGAKALSTQEIFLLEKYISNSLP